MCIDLMRMTAEFAEILPYGEDELINRFMPLSDETIGNLLAIADDNSHLWFAIYLDSVMVGDIFVMLESGEVSIAVRIMAACRGKGMLASVIDKMIDVLHVEYQWQFNELFAGISDKNLASQKAFEKIGFRYYGSNDGICEYMRTLTESSRTAVEIKHDHITD